MAGGWKRPWWFQDTPRKQISTLLDVVKKHLDAHAGEPIPADAWGDSRDALDQAQEILQHWTNLDKWGREWGKHLLPTEVKVAKLRGSHDEQTIHIGDQSFRVSMIDGDVVDMKGKTITKYSAFVTIGRLEEKLKAMGITHCIDLDSDGPDQQIPIDEFFRVWKTFVALRHD